MPLPPLSPQDLCRTCDPTLLPFETTESLADVTEPVGQERAAEGLRFGLDIQREGYHVFAMGRVETGKRTFVRGVLDRRAAGEPVPGDLCYVHNFREPHRPKAILLPPGKGDELRRDLETLLDDLKNAIPQVLESDEQRTKKQLIESEAKEQHEKALEDLRQDAESKGIAFLHTPLGFAFAPMKDGEVLSPEQFGALADEERTRIEHLIEGLQDRLRSLLEQAHEREKAVRGRVRAMLRELTATVVGGQIEALRRKYAVHPPVVEHLVALEHDVVEHVGDFLQTPSGPAALAAALGQLEAQPGLAPIRRYLVNVLVRHEDGGGAPVVYEDHPTHENLIGRVEHLAQMGTLVTDFLLIKPGALHRANGGYLVLEVHNLLMQPYAWEALKRALLTKEVRIESIGQKLGLVSTVSLQPEPVPLDVKVVLLGDRMLYELLDRYDPEFRPLFKVAADFDDEMPRSPEGDLLYARLVATAARREGLRVFHRDAVARVLERSSREAGDAERLSTHMGTLMDLLREADFWAGRAGRPLVRAEDVERAVEAAEQRSGRVRERLLEEIRKGTLLLDATGERVGQVNGLAVYAYGRSAFGRPNRITAKVRLGKGEVVDIEREVELGGPIHSKGVMILSSFLGARYAPEEPLSLSASLVFEQSYGPIEGDSASLAELLALLSALADVPLRQSLAVTGSVNQHGEVQPIGGVNEKIEGFFDACRVLGADGVQGVVVPATNVRHLMLRRDVVEAVRAGRFRVFAVRTVDEALELFTGLPAGVRDSSGAFPPGSVNRRVEDRLVALARRRRALAEDGKPKEDAP